MNKIQDLSHVIHRDKIIAKLLTGDTMENSLTIEQTGGYSVGDIVSWANKETVITSINQDYYMRADQFGWCWNLKFASDRPKLIKSISSDLRVGDKVIYKSTGLGIPVDGVITKIRWDPDHRKLYVDMGNEKGHHFDDLIKVADDPNREPSHKFKIGDTLSLVAMPSRHTIVTLVHKDGFLDTEQENGWKFKHQKPDQYELVSRAGEIKPQPVDIKEDQCKYVKKVISSSYARIYRQMTNGDPTAPIQQQIESINAHAAKAALRTMREVPVCNMSGQPVNVVAKTTEYASGIEHNRCDLVSTTVYFICKECN